MIVARTADGRETVLLVNSSGALVVSGSAAPTLTPAQAYLARTVGGNEGGNAANITALIDGLVADGVWAHLDALYVLAQQNATDSLLNLVSASYTLPTDGTFVAYQGYHGFVTGMHSTLDPATAGLQYTLNSATAGVWVYSFGGTASTGVDLGGTTANNAIVVGDFSHSGLSYTRINDATSVGVTTAGVGLLTGDRSSSSLTTSYQNGVASGTSAVGPAALVSEVFNIGGGPVYGASQNTLSAAVIGGSLGDAGQLALYNRLQTYMTAVSLLSTWNASDAAANGMTLSNGGLTVTPSGLGGWGSVRGSTSKASGKVYVEFSTSAAISGNVLVGTASAGFNSVDYLGNSNYSAGHNIVAGYTYNSTEFTVVSTPYYGTVAANDVFGLAIDFTAQRIWVSYNNVWRVVRGSDKPVPRDPATGTLPNYSFVAATVGALFPALSFNGAGAGTWTLQTTAASQKYAPPAGFIAWDSPPMSPAQAYLARTVGGNEGGNAANITALIDGLVADGVWAHLDALYVFAQQNETDAQLNLIETRYPAGYYLTPTFTPYVGFSFPGNSNLDTGFNAFIAPSAKYTQNSASYGVWSYSIVEENYAVMGNGGGGPASILYPKYIGGSFYARVNDILAGPVPTPGTSGLFIGDRSVSSAVVPYWNGVSQGSVASTSSGLTNASFTIGTSQGSLGAETRTTAQTLSAAFIGASLGDAGQLALYNRLQTYMIAVGVTHSPQALAYLARTVGGDEGGNATNIANLIDGLVADGVWAKLDALYVLAQQNEADALLNLIGTSYTLTPNGATFTAYQGYVPTGYGLDTGFNPATAVGAKYSQDAASASGWNFGGYGAIISGSPAPANLGIIINTYANDYTDINNVGGGGPPDYIPAASVNGLYSGDRNSATSVISYINGVDAAEYPQSSGAPNSSNIAIGSSAGAYTFLGTISAAHIGGSLGAAGQLALYNRLATYMAAIPATKPGPKPPDQITPHRGPDEETDEE